MPGEERTDKRAVAIGDMSAEQWQAFMRAKVEETQRMTTGIERYRKAAGIWLNATADARIALAVQRELGAAAAQFLRSPALHRIRVGETWFTRKTLADALEAANAG